MKQAGKRKSVSGSVIGLAMATSFTPCPSAAAQDQAGWFGTRSAWYEQPGERGWSVREVRDLNGDGFEDMVFVADDFGALHALGGYALGRAGWSFDEPVVFWTHVQEFWASRAVAARLGEHAEPVMVARDGERVRAYLPVVISDTWIDDDAQLFAEDPGLSYFDEFDARYNEGELLLAGDLDGDGLDELVLASEQAEFAVRWSSRTAGERYEVITTAASLVLLPLADYNADGLLDVLGFDSGSGGLVLYAGTVTDALGPAIALGFRDVFQRRLEGVLFGEFDGRPGVDLAVDNRGQLTFVYGFATGEPTVSEMARPGTPVPLASVLQDLDGDGIDELVVSTDSVGWAGPARRLYVRSVWYNPGTPEAWLGQEVVLPTNLLPFGPYHAEDANADGRLDIIGFEQGWNAVLTRRGITGRTEPRQWVGESLGSFLHFLPVDLDGDGYPEVIAAGSNSAILDLNAPDGDRRALAEDDSGFMSVLGDFDGDGADELALIAFDSVLIYEIIGDGTLGEPEVIAATGEDQFLGASVGDFTGDGADDLLVTYHSPGGVRVLTRDGVNGWTVYADLGPWYCVKPAAYDLDGNGFSDAIVGDENTGVVRAVLNNGDGTFREAWSAPGAGYWIEAGDVDGDGIADAVVTGGNFSGGFQKLVVWFGEGDGVFTGEQIIRLPGEVVEVLIRDLDDDGLAELIACETIGFLPNSGVADSAAVIGQKNPRVFEVEALLPTSVSSGLAVADFNNDGSMDLGMVGTLRRGMIYWGAERACLADLTGDGQADAADMQAYLSAFQAKDPSADLAQPFARWNFFDVVAYLDAFTNGCSE